MSEKHLFKFQTENDYETAKGNNLVIPNVSTIVETGNTYINTSYDDPYNGHDYVDLGLPSGTLWATMNVGANSETAYGNYYMYGMGSKTYDSTDTIYEGTEDPLDLSRDTAAQVWGGEWHIPTKAQYEELIANTTHQWITDYQESGINGELFTAQNGNSVFLPAAGYWLGGHLNYAGSWVNYLSSSPKDTNYYQAYALSFEPEDANGGVVSSRRESGLTVRPVVG